MTLHKKRKKSYIILSSVTSCSRIDVCDPTTRFPTIPHDLTRTTTTFL